MNKRDYCYLAVKNIKSNLFRSYICILAVAIGVLAVIIIDTISGFGQQAINTQIDSIGIDGVSIYIQDNKSDVKLNAQDAEDIVSVFGTNVKTTSLVVKYGSYKTSRLKGDALLCGVDSNIQDIMNLRFAYGDIFSKKQVDAAARNVIIDKNLAYDLYKRENVVGKNLKLSVDGVDESYKIIGVIEPQAGAITSLAGGAAPSFIYVPYTCISTNGSIDQIIVKCDDGQEQVVERIKEYLNRKNRDSLNLGSQNISAYIQTFDNIVKSIRWMLVAIGLISFFVAMIGVANSMMSAVNERKNEIGIYLALGAKKQHIIKLILAEASVICIIGAVFGIIIGILLIGMLSLLLGIKISVSIGIVITVLVISFLCGVISAILPARTATKLKPIEALRK